MFFKRINKTKLPKLKINSKSNVRLYQYNKRNERNTDVIDLVQSFSTQNGGHVCTIKLMLLCCGIRIVKFLF